MLTLFLLLLLLLCLHGIFVCLYWRARKYLKNLPSYSQLPFFGSMHWFLGGGEIVFRRLTEISKIMDKTNLPFVVWIGPRPLMLVSNPDDVRTVTNAFLDKPYFYNFARDWLGEGLVLVPGEVWKRNIKKIAGSFTGNVVEGFQEVFNVSAHELVKKFKMEVGKEPFDAMPYLSLMTLRTICQTALGVNYTSDSEITKNYHDAFTTALELMIKRGTNWLLHFDCLYRLTADYKQFEKAVQVMHSLSDRVIMEKQLERELIKRKNDLDTEKSSGKFKSILDMLLDLSETDQMSESQMRAEVNTLIVGGQDTVAATLYYTILMLGSNAGAQDTLYAEVKQVFSKSGAIDREALGRLVYCEAAITETLRLYPPIPAVTRYADRDLDLKSCKIPKGTFCTLNLWGAGRSERAWGPDAELYKPERWLSPNTPSVASYMPFSTGRRACIGKKYAMALLKTTLAYCVKHLIFVSEAEKLEFKMDVGLRATSGYLLQVKLRN